MAETWVCDQCHRTIVGDLDILKHGVLGCPEKQRDRLVPFADLEVGEMFSMREGSSVCVKVDEAGFHHVGEVLRDGGTSYVTLRDRHELVRRVG